MTRVREHRYPFYVIYHFGRVDFSRIFAHVRRLNFTRAFIHGICSVFIPLKATNHFHLQIIETLLVLYRRTSRPRDAIITITELDVETIFRPTHDAKQKAKPTDFSRLALHFSTFRTISICSDFKSKSKQNFVFNDVPLRNVHGC